MVPSQQQRAMTSLKPSQTERSAGGCVLATDEFHMRHLRLPNGPAPPLRSESTHPATRPGVPKMGVRDRVADWPPRKDTPGVWPVSMDSEPPSAVGGGPGSLPHKPGLLISPQDCSMLRNIQKTLKSKTQGTGTATTTDPSYLSPDEYRGPPRRPSRRVRQRSNSDITVGELDGDGDSLEDWDASGYKWSPIHREYGSTSSIDKHAGGESFFDMLKGYQGDKPDQRSPAPEKLGDLLTASHKQAGLDVSDGPMVPSRGNPSGRSKSMNRRNKSDTGGDSIFRKLRNSRAEGDSSRAGSDAEDGRSEDGTSASHKPWVCQKGFAHYDVQSILFDLNEAVQSKQVAVKLRNTKTGASAVGSQEELDSGDGKSNELVLSCPCFRNEIGGEGERTISLSKLGSIGRGGIVVTGDGNPCESSLSSHCTNAGVAVLEMQKDGQGLHSERSKRYSVEHVDLGAYYYRKYFYVRGERGYSGMTSPSVLLLS